MSEIKKQWYVVRAIGGKEGKVKEYIEAEIRHNHLEDYISQVLIPTEKVYTIRNGKKVSKEKVSYPGYVLVRMIETSESWYLVRNTRGVTGFVGPGSKPIPLTDEEVTAMGVERMQLELDIKVGEHVRVVSDPFANFIGTVQAIDPETQRIRLIISLFGKETPIELDFVEVQKL